MNIHNWFSFSSQLLVCTPLRFAVNGLTLLAFFSCLSSFLFFIFLFILLLLLFWWCLHARDKKWVSVNAIRRYEHWQIKQCSNQFTHSTSTFNINIENALFLSFFRASTPPCVRVLVCMYMQMKRISGTQLFWKRVVPTHKTDRTHRCMCG